MIQLENVSKVYEDGFQAINNLNLTFEEGEINVLIGPSGCGKSTTMKMLNRLVEHTSGKITIDGQDINDLNPVELRRKMGYVIQNIGLFPHMTIYDNVAAVPKLLKWDKQRIQERVKELLEMVNLDPEIYMNRYPNELSGGQQQRIGVIRALAAEPSTILMDEPFSALDPISREQLQDELVGLQKEIKKTIIFVTHDMDEAIKIANQIILMKDGEVVQKGTPEEILTAPENEFVEKFIGEERLEQAKLMPKLSDVMETNYPTIRLDASIHEAIDKMTKENIYHLPVIDNETEEFMGVISLNKAITNQDGRMDQLLNKNHLIQEETDLSTTLTKFEKTTITILPVVATNGKLLGVIQSSNLFQVFKRNLGNKRGGQ